MQSMLSVLRHRTQALSNPALSNLQVRQADALHLPFADASFDHVLIANLWHLLPEPSLALAEAMRVLQPGGVLITPTFCHGAN